MKKKDVVWILYLFTVVFLICKVVCDKELHRIGDVLKAKKDYFTVMEQVQSLSTISQEEKKQILEAKREQFLEIARNDVLIETNPLVEICFLDKGCQELYKDGTVKIKPLPNGDIKVPFLQELCQQVTAKINSGGILKPMKITNFSPSGILTQALSNYPPAVWVDYTYCDDPELALGCKYYEIVGNAMKNGKIMELRLPVGTKTYEHLYKPVIDRALEGKFPINVIVVDKYVGKAGFLVVVLGLFLWFASVCAVDKTALFVLLVIAYHVFVFLSYYVVPAHAFAIICIITLSVTDFFLFIIYGACTGKEDKSSSANKF